MYCVASATEKTNKNRNINRRHIHLSSRPPAVSVAAAPVIRRHEFRHFRDSPIAFSCASARKSLPAPKKAAPPRLGTQTRKPRIIQNRIFITERTPLRGSTNFGLEYPKNCSYESSMKDHVYFSRKNGTHQDNTAETRFIQSDNIHFPQKLKMMMKKMKLH